MLNSYPLVKAAFRLVQRALDRQSQSPVAPYISAEDLPDRIDFSLPVTGVSDAEVESLLDQIAQAAPRTASPRFLNQLFGGRDDAALAGEILAVALNNSMYTYKASGANAVVELELTRHMARIVGFTEGEGVFAAGGSMSNFTAIVMARNEADPDIREHGHDGAAMTLYTSAISHYSITKGAALAGVGRENVRPIPCDDRGRMIPEKLRAAIKRDLDAGRRPFLINATAGTTVLGAFDPIRSLAAIAQEFNLWLHVDGALGAPIVLSNKHRHVLDGVELADSLTWDAHKLMTVPLVASVILVKKPGLLAKHFSEDASYLFQSDSNDVNFGGKSLQCGRTNDALKVWALWKHHGDAGLGRCIDRLFELARHTADLVRQHPELRLTKNPESVNVCFEAIGVPSDVLCEQLRQRELLVVGYGEVDGRDVVRIPMVNPDLTFEQMSEAVELICEVAADLRNNPEVGAQSVIDPRCC